MAKKVSPTVANAVNQMYAKMARAAAKTAVEKAEIPFAISSANDMAKWAEVWAIRAGGNALHYGLF